MEQKYVLGILALAMVAILGVSMVSAFGFGNGFMNSELTEEEKAEMQEQKEVMKTAIENKDYGTWKSLMEDRLSEMQEKITEENFDELTQRHEKMSEFREAVKELKDSGDFSKEDIQNLQEEYGVEGKRFGKGKGFGMKNSGKCPLTG